MNETLALLVKRHRTVMNLSQTELARRAGIAQGVISRIETGAYKEVPPVDVLEGLSRELNIPQAAMLEALGYQVTEPDAPVSDPLSASIARAVSGWTPAQKRLLWQYIEAVSTALDEVDPPEDEDVRESGAG